MRWARNLSRWLAAVAAGLLSVSLVLALVGIHPGGKTSPVSFVALEEKKADPIPIFANPIPAANEPVLVIQADDRGVHGWVAGKTESNGAKVSIRARGRDYEATVQPDNTFVWEHTTRRNLPVSASLTLADGKKLTARTTLPAAPPAGGPTIFFITDRSAYRPGHTIKFAAFLRKLLPNGEFEPIRNQEVTIDLTSAIKQTRAARLKLQADDFGRVTGEYSFSAADALDYYTLTADGYSGDAKVLLGEYRKSKVGLKLNGEVKDGKLTVTFDARDFLDRPVKGTAASYVATVSRTAEPEKLTLNPDAFAKPEGGPPSADEFDVLPDDERLLTLANGVSAMTFAGFGSRFVSSREGTISMPADGATKLELDLKPEWLKGNHAVTMSGVFTDETGRENSATATFKLDPKPAKGVRVSTPKELFATGEKIPVSLTPFGMDGNEKPSTTLVLVRLIAQPATPWNTTYSGNNIPMPGFDDQDNEGTLPGDTRLPPLSATRTKKLTPEGWKTLPVFDPVKREIHSILPVANDSAEATLKKPGAYKLVAITKLADGSTVQSETGVVVKAPTQLPGLILHLDKREIDSGTQLSGSVHTRFAGAKLLLTLRDSTGIKLTRTLTTGGNGVAQIDEPLPANLRYGCAVCVQYPESANTIHADQRELFVIPTDRTIKVATTVPPEFGPGAEVPLTVQIDRQEETDLIVSVYDESLLGVSGDLSKDIRNYYLGDTRVLGKAARELAATRAGSIAVADLVKKAAELLEDKDGLSREVGLEQQLQGLLTRWKADQVAVTDVVTLVRLAGLEVYLAEPICQNPTWKISRNATLADLLRWERHETIDPKMKLSVSATVIGNVALLGIAIDRSNDDSSFSRDPWAYHRNNPYGHGFGCIGQFGQLGFGGQFGLAGQLGFAGQFATPNYLGGLGFQGVGGHTISGFQGLGFTMNGGFSGGFAGIGGGMVGRPGGNTIYSGFQGSFSHPGGQMGMSFGWNRDFAAALPGLSSAGPLPGLGIGQEMVRRDFADSAFWSARLRTDKTGKATTTFKVPDSLTNWRVQVTAISSKMHVGSGNTKFKTIRPIMIWPMLPRTFTEGDVVRIFGTVHNLTEKEQSIQVNLTTENGQVLDEPERTVLVPPKGNVPVYWSYRAGTKGFTDLLMSAKCESGSDASLKKLPVTAAAVLERATASGLVSKGKLIVTLPKDFDPARASASITIAPTIAADLDDTLPYLVDYPYGCVEQTMSRFLPAIRVAQILRQSGISTVKNIEAKLPKVVEAGQKRLIELQQPDGGWAWQGNGTTHEMMTPYALFGLIQAEEAGYPCPNPRTIEAGMARLRGYLEAMSRTPNYPNVLNDAVYSLGVYSLRCDEKELSIWLTRIESFIGGKIFSDFGHAIALELAVKKGKKDLADKLATELRKRAKKSGDQVYWTTAGFSRWGDNTIEITAAVMKALVAYDSNDPLIPGILAFFHASKRGDRWDSTKDTACVLYALCDYLAAVKAGPAATGLVKVNVNGLQDGKVTLDSSVSRRIMLSGKNLKPGENIITVTGEDTAGGALARAVVSFTRGRGAEISAQDSGVKVTRTISVRGEDGKWKELKSGATVPVGSYVKVQVIASPDAPSDFNYALLESPKPAGGETVPVEDKRFSKSADANQHVLREDREAMTCFHYENPQLRVAAEYVVLTEFAGEFRIAPARFELMYKPTVGGHSASFVLNVTDKKQNKTGEK